MSVNMEDNGSWSCQFWYINHNGERKHKHKRGFDSEKEAAAYERDFLKDCGELAAMTFEEYFERYVEDNKPRVRASTWATKELKIKNHILPFFAKMPLREITTRDVIRWQNLMREKRTKFGKPYSEAMLRSFDETLCTLFNHAVRYYGLADNPAKKVPRMGSSKVNEIQIWTQEEFVAFADAVADKPRAFYAFEMLYWTGMRLGELLALTPADFDFNACMVTISKTRQTNGDKLVGPPKTEKSYRTISLPEFLSEEMDEYVHSYLKIDDDQTIFEISKSFLHHEMDRGCKKSGVKRIRIHDLRHSHVSMLIDMGFSPVAIGERVGHKSKEITFRYAHLFPGDQTRMAERLDAEQKKEY